MYYLLLILLVISCGREDQTKKDCTVKGERCHTNERTDTTQPVISYQPGPAGAAGQPGKDGIDGLTTLITTIQDNNCVIFIAALDSNKNNMIDTFDTGYQSATVCNGTDGINGQNGQDGTNGTNGINAPVEFSVIQMIDPCGDYNGIYDEVLLKLGSGKILASFSDNANGQNTRFSVLSPGSYQTTDGSMCKFTVDNDNNVINEHY